MTSSPETKSAGAHRRESKITPIDDANTAPRPQFNLEQELSFILQTAADLMDVSLSLIALRRYESEPLRVVAANQTRTSFSQTELETLSQSLSAGWALTQQQVVLLSQEQLESKFYMLPGLVEVIYAPLMVGGKGVGLLCLVDVQPGHRWDEEALALAQRLAHQAGLTVEMARSYDFLRRCLGGSPMEKEALHALLTAWETIKVATVQLVKDWWHQDHQLKASEHRFQSLVDSAQDAVVIVQDRQFRSVNHHLTELLGYSLEECYRMDTMLDLVADRHRSMVAENQSKKLQGEPVPPYEFVATDKGGAEVMLEATGSVVEYDGRPAIQEIWRDVTRQRQLRAQLLLSEKMAAMGQLISGVAHELNNPLTAVLGFSELVLMNNQLSEELRRDLKTIMSEAHRARKIVQNLLSFAHTPDSEKRLSDVNQIMADTLALKEYELRMNHIEVIKQLDPHLPPVIADVDQLKQVFLNVIVNAEQAVLETKTRGRLEIRTGVKTCSIAGSASDWVEIRIRDTGPGIPPEHLSRIFDLFFTTKELGQGTGLGLAISYNIIKDHGGRMYAQNAPGGGTEFIIELPVQTQ